ncbi:hypothetical protein ACFPN2_20270 [Steroidobacter flavus]|uniref:Uncharacterized protein n=1 Tax=Steroidobacter flavus TaxID=1842136 RepID=A0ABV8SWP3_9GAMM
MAIFRVMFSGQKVLLKTHDGVDVCGFVRNEYVRAQTREEAIEKAERKVLERVRNHEGIVELSDSTLQLTVDDVEEGFPPWKLLANESFIFFDIESAATTKGKDASQ